MKSNGRYRATGSEAEFEPGSRGKVLRNKLEIKTLRGIETAESRAMGPAMKGFLGLYDSRHRFTSNDIRYMHRVWLGEIYEWAGEYRNVNMSKGNLMFAVAVHLPSLMGEFEREVLGKQTPCDFSGKNRIVEALARVHVEFILLHPFREGNGRLGRMLTALMAAQAGYPLLNFRVLDGHGKEGYFKAVRCGLDRNYKPMEGIFRKVLKG